MKHGRKKSQAGSALVEFALASTLIIMLGLGAVSFGLAVQSSIMVADAANAGALYGANNTLNATNTTAMNSAAIMSGAGVKNLTSTANYWCTCTASRASVACTSACGSDQPFYWVQVTTTATFNNFFNYMGLPSAFTLQSSSIMLVQ